MGKKYKQNTMELLNDPKYRKKTSMIRMTKQEYVRKIKMTVGATAVIAFVAGGYAHKGMEYLNKRQLLSQEIIEFHGDVINPNTHRTTDNNGYWYAYDKIAQAIMSSDNVEESVYLAYRNFGMANINDVLKYTPYKTFEGFLSQEGYKDEEQFQSILKEQIMVGQMIEQQEEELAKVKMKKYTLSK